MSMTRYQKELVNKVMEENELLREQLGILSRQYSKIRDPEKDHPSVNIMLLLAEINLTGRRNAEEQMK